MFKLKKCIILRKKKIPHFQFDGNKISKKKLEKGHICQRVASPLLSAPGLLYCGAMLL